MSHLVGDISPFSLEKGFTFCAVLEITATGQKRRKVIYEIYSDEHNRPILQVRLNKNDELSVAVFDNEENCHETTKISATEYAAYSPSGQRPKECTKAFLLTIRIETSILEHQNYKINIELFIDGKLKAKGCGHGHFYGTCSARSSIGASIDGKTPATFTLGEIAVFNRSLGTKELEQLNQYFNNKWNVGVKNED